MSVFTPCKGCPDRHIGCHGYCARYDQYRVDVAEERQRRKDYRLKSNARAAFSHIKKTEKGGTQGIRTISHA